MNHINTYQRITNALLVHIQRYTEREFKLRKMYVQISGKKRFVLQIENIKTSFGLDADMETRIKAYDLCVQRASLAGVINMREYFKYCHISDKFTNYLIKE